MASDEAVSFRFRHHQLDVNGVARKLVVAVRRLMERRGGVLESIERAGGRRAPVDRR